MIEHDVDGAVQSLRSYPILDVPLVRPFDRMTKRDRAAYQEWYEESRGRRIAVLAGYLGVRPPTSAVETLAVLHRAAIELRTIAREVRLTDQEIVERRTSAGPLLGPSVPDTDLSLETVAFCYDFGMLLGAYIQDREPQALLSVEAASKRDFDYGHVLVCIPGQVPMNPYRKCTVLAEKALDGMDTVAELDRVIEYYLGK